MKFMIAFLFTVLQTPLCLATPQKITFVLTNDLHGRIGPQLLGLEQEIQSLKRIEADSEGQFGVVVLDAGDQFQGTLESNFTEGESVVHVMNQLGYDAVVPGNHDYDFGPLGWLYDKVIPGKTSSNPREAIERLATLARFSFVSANTYFKNSLQNFKKDLVKVDDQCRPLDKNDIFPIEFENASRPSFLAPYRILHKAGARIAVIGIDLPETSTVTTYENVSDLCFRDEVETYLEVYNSIKEKADIFVLLVHNGNTSKSNRASKIAEVILKKLPHSLHLVAAGHTHWLHNDVVNGIVVQQNDSYGRKFGKVTLTFDPETKQVQTDFESTRSGIENEKIILSNEFKSHIALTLKDIELKVGPMKGQPLITIPKDLKRDRYRENEMGNLLTDALRLGTQADIAMLNMGGIRDQFKTGVLTYGNLFEVLPFNNEGILFKVATWKTLKQILEKTITSCGRFGYLAFSGLKVEIDRDCTGKKEEDPAAKLVKVTTLRGRVLFDRHKGFEISERKKFSLVVPDFIASGGSGNEAFKELSNGLSKGVVREIISNSLKKNGHRIQIGIDGRFKNVGPTGSQEAGQSNR